MAARSSLLRSLACNSALSFPRQSLARQTTCRSFSKVPYRAVVQRFAVPHIQRRWDSSAQSRETREDWTICSFDQVLEYSKASKEKPLIIDVREPYEFAEGHIPSAVNVPVNSAPDAMFLDPDTFEEKFGFEKPETDAPMLFYCKAGVRSRASAMLAKSAGYKNLNEYRGSYDDWLDNNGPSESGGTQ